MTMATNIEQQLQPREIIALSNFEFVATAVQTALFQYRDGTFDSTAAAELARCTALACREVRLAYPVETPPPPPTNLLKF